jgi:hypothetical protein
MYFWFSVQDVVVKDILLSFAHYFHAVSASKWIFTQGPASNCGAPLCRGFVTFFISTIVSM